MADLYSPTLSANYIPWWAWEGSYVPLKSSTITNYPSSGFGKFAQLVYQVGSNSSFTPVITANYNPDWAYEGSFVPLDTSTLSSYPSSGFGKFAQLVWIVGTNTAITPSFSSNYIPGWATEGNFVSIDASSLGYPTTGFGKFAKIVRLVGSTISLGLKLSASYIPSWAFEGSFVPLNMSTESTYPTAGVFGKFAQLVYVVGTSQTLTPLITNSYIPDWAEEGSYVALNPATLTNYPSASGFGKFAQLVYVIGS